MLARAGLDAAALACGAHPPIHAPSAQALARSGREPSALHNNCSGKHAGFLCVACAMGADPAGYTDPAHPVQRAVKAVLEGIAGVALDDRSCAMDGCSAPTWALPLAKLAHGFARFGTGRGLDPHRAEAAARIRAACAARPYLAAGTGRFCTRVMAHFGGRVLVKGGAEGVLCGALPEAGIGVAIKCDDGAARAARDGATIATPVHAEFPDMERVHWRLYDGKPQGSRLIRMAPWFDDGSLIVHLEARYYWQGAAEAHRRVEQGHTQGKLVLIVDDDLAAALEV